MQVVDEGIESLNEDLQHRISEIETKDASIAQLNSLVQTLQQESTQLGGSMESYQNTINQLQQELQVSTN